MDCGSGGLAVDLAKASRGTSPLRLSLIGPSLSTQLIPPSLGAWKCVELAADSLDIVRRWRGDEPALLLSRASIKLA
jgi:hypothetical protein